MKKILIVTLPQGANYGGMLQAYALKESINNLGFSAQTTFSKGPCVRRVVKSIPGIRFVIRKIKGHEKKDARSTDQYTREFVAGRLFLSDFDKAYILSSLGAYGAYIVGSDQVWRKSYTYIPHNLFSFVRKQGSVKISYAASFGRDNLNDYDNGLMKKTKKLAQKFNAISVREDSGVDIVKKYWGLEAEHHVDPTLLLDAKDYANLIDNPTCEIHPSEGDLFSYVLDTNQSKQGIADIVAKAKGLTVFTVIDGDENNGKPMPPVEQWLRSFRDAKYVVTDSFHGTVFSIIFNKPFIAIGNKSRGLARFTSLLKIFGLEDRLVLDVSEVTPELINAKINWGKVNAIKDREQKRSMEYLKKHLK